MEGSESRMVLRLENVLVFVRGVGVGDPAHLLCLSKIHTRDSCVVRLASCL